MKKNSSLMLVVTFVILLIGAGLYMSAIRKPDVSNQAPQTTSDAQTEQQIVQPEEEVVAEEGVNTNSFSGTKLAGKIAVYLEYNKADYDRALSEDRIIFLDFYASWCPICRGEAPEIEAGFDQLQADRVVGFRVNYKDPDTDADEKALAEQFEIPYQHYKVILKNGQVVLKDGEVWDKQRFLEEIKKAI